MCALAVAGPVRLQDRRGAASRAVQFGQPEVPKSQHQPSLGRRASPSAGWAELLANLGRVRLQHQRDAACCVCCAAAAERVPCCQHQHQRAAARQLGPAAEPTGDSETCLLRASPCIALCTCTSAGFHIYVRVVMALSMQTVG
jgi:hypothetical protein